jgi:putative ABC transport system substrate-binding protein
MVDRPTILKIVIVTGVLLFAVLRGAEAQPSGKVSRVAMVITTPSSAAMTRKGLGELGYVDGRNLVIDYRSVEGRLERYSAIFDELLARAPDVMIVAGAPGIRAARRATARVPIVAVDLESDPVAAGFVKSLARPGGNITGVFLDMPEVAGKQLQFLRETLPALTRVAVLWDPSINQTQFQAIETVARTAGITVSSLPVKGAEEIEPAVSQAGRERANALLVLPSPVMFANWRRIAGLGLTHRLTSTSTSVGFPQNGGLMAYGPSALAMYQRLLPTYVDRILKGTSPAELPVERPTAFELVINLKTAKVLGLTIPPSLLLRADQVIE